MARWMVVLAAMLVAVPTARADGLVATPAALDLGTVPLGQKVTVTFVLENQGAKPAKGITCKGKGLTLSPKKLAIAAGESAAVTATYQAAKKGKPHALALTIKCGKTTIAVAGNLGAKQAYATPAAEVGTSGVKVDLPKVPDVSVPPVNADGTSSVARLLALGHSHFGDAVKLHGFVVAVYDCARDLRAADASLTADAAAKKIKADPTLCEKPHLWVGDAADALPEQAILVVDSPTSGIAAGEAVTIDGTWDDHSASGFRNDDGLVVFGKLE